METNEEIWKDIIGYEGMYQVSNRGEVKSLARICLTHRGHKRYVREKILKKCIGKTGYWTVGLSKKCKGRTTQIHKLMALGFIDNPQNKKCVNHINGVKTDNKLDNLEWATHRENNIHAFNIGLKKNPTMADGRIFNGKKTACVSMGGEIIKIYPSARNAARELGICSIRLSLACRGSITSYGGYKWKYIKNEEN